MSKRDQIITALKEKLWFQNTNQEIQQQLFALPKNCDGFLQHLSNRPDEIQGVKILKIAEIYIPQSQPIYQITVNFQLEKKGQTGHYQCASWKQGPASGVKGIVLIRNEKTKLFTHLILLKSLKLGIGAMAYDCIGGFLEQGETSYLDSILRFLTELEEELGLEKIPPYERIINLGNFNPDAGMINNCPQLFAIIFSSKYLDQIIKANKENPDLFETTEKIIIPVQDLEYFTNICNDSFVHVILTRLWTRGINLFNDCLVLSLAK